MPNTDRDLAPLYDCLPWPILLGACLGLVATIAWLLN